eukprot:2687805-Rhodomonas_salina.3
MDSVLVEEFGQSGKELFKSIEDEPIGAASLAQSYGCGGRWVMCGTGIAYASAICSTEIAYVGAMCGTELAYGGSVCGTELAYEDQCA